MSERIAQSRNAPPRASAMLEALRGLGYSTSTALADLIDNSIAAHSEVVNVTFSWKGENSAICIVDDGEAMSAEVLDRAMRLGERSPLEKRASHDLGRFGLGLKTASFSQCRRLTVASRQKEEMTCLCWDLDVLAECQDDGWYLLEGPANGSEDLVLPLNEVEHGTLVLWEVLDRIVTPGYTEQNFLDLMDRVEQHLAMVFHRYIEGARPRLRIIMNGRPISPWNPFLLNHSATWSSPIVPFNTEAGLVVVQGYVLPHRDRLDPQEYERAAGPDGWTAQQGFYIYRNERLLVAGGWLGLGHGRAWTQEESHRLARIRIDIPNSADTDWQIDIRKSKAKPPVNVKARLIHLAENIRHRARRVFAHRSQPIRLGGQDPIALAWRADHFNGGMRYRIDQSHPAVKTVLEDASFFTPQIKAMLRIIEETVPVQRIWLDTTEGKEVPRTGFSGDGSSDVLEVLQVMYRNMVQKKGIAPNLAREQLLRTEPFHNYPDLVKGLPDEP